MKPGLAIYSASQHAKPKDLLPFGPAFTQQVTDVCDAYGLAYPEVRIVEAKSAIPSGWGWIVIADNIAGVPDALAFHTKDIDGTISGVCDAEKILSLGGTLARGALSITAATGHELAEAAVDGPCNRYAQAPNGDVWCLEVADPVQGFAYKSRDGKADLSSFVKANFFDLVMAEAFQEGKIDSSTLGPLDKTEQIDTPFSVGPGGYAVILRHGRPIQIGAETPTHKIGLPSRRERRLANFVRHFGTPEEPTTPRKAFSFPNISVESIDGAIEALSAAAGVFAAVDPTDAAKIRAAFESIFAPRPTGGAT